MLESSVVVGSCVGGGTVFLPDRWRLVPLRVSPVWALRIECPLVVVSRPVFFSSCVRVLLGVFCLVFGCVLIVSGLVGLAVSFGLLWVPM